MGSVADGGAAALSLVPSPWLAVTRPCPGPPSPDSAPGVPFPKAVVPWSSSAVGPAHGLVQAEAAPGAAQMWAHAVRGRGDRAAGSCRGHVSPCRKVPIYGWHCPSSSGTL